MDNSVVISLGSNHNLTGLKGQKRKQGPIGCTLTVAKGLNLCILGLHLSSQVKHQK